MLYVQRLGYSASMQAQIGGALREFLNQYDANANAAEIEAHYHYLSQRPNQRRAGGLSSITIGHHLYALRLWFSWLVEEGYRMDHPMSGLVFPKVVYSPRAVLSLGEIQRLYAYCKHPRERGLLGIYYGCGLRRIEGERLDLRDVQLKSGLLYIRAGKGGKRRVVPISKGIIEDLKAYLETERRERVLRCKRPDPKAFFINHVGSRTRGSVHYLHFKQLLARTGLSQEISLHHLRHSIATHLLQKGMAIEAVRDFLGHQHLESTQIYTRMES